MSEGNEGAAGLTIVPRLDEELGWEMEYMREAALAFVVFAAMHDANITPTELIVDAARAGDGNQWRIALRHAGGSMVALGDTPGEVLYKFMRVMAD